MGALLGEGCGGSKDLWQEQSGGWCRWNGQLRGPLEGGPEDRASQGHGRGLLRIPGRARARGVWALPAASVRVG